MAEETGRRRVHERWAHLRFSVIGQLLAAPPDKGELKAAIEALAARIWRHPNGPPFVNELQGDATAGRIVKTADGYQLTER